MEANETIPSSALKSELKTIPDLDGEKNQVFGIPGRLARVRVRVRARAGTSFSNLIESLD